MKKVIAQGIILVMLFFLSWFALYQVDWMSVFKVEQNTKKTEEKLGEMFWEIFRKTNSENSDPFILNSIDSLVTKICDRNHMDKSDFKIHVLNNNEINAFALPNGHLVIFTGLILAADDPCELSGVICHEIAHIKLNHVMKKLIKEVGLSALISISAGNSGPEIISEAARILSSTAFDRKLEKEADIGAVEYMIKADIDPEPFANFLYKLADMDPELVKYLTWVSTHPESKERAEYIIDYISSVSYNKEQVITQQTWDKIKLQLAE